MENSINSIVGKVKEKSIAANLIKTLESLKKEKKMSAIDYWPFIDIFTFHENNDNLKFFRNTYEKNHFFPLESVKFYDINVYIPKNPDYFLSKNYGNDYMIKLVSSAYCHQTEKSTNTKYVITMEEYIKHSE